MTKYIKTIDNLGRILLPKELREKLKIKNGDSIEISQQNKNIILKKYSKLSEINDIDNIHSTISHFIKHNIIITDRDKIISSTKKELINKSISQRLETSIQRREQIYENNKKKLEIIDKKDIIGYYIINSLIIKNDVVGLVIVYDTEKEITSEENKTLTTIIKFINKYLEE